MLGFCMSMKAQIHPDLFTQYKFHRLNELDGLTNNIMNDIVQDTLGQIWVATEGGLFRYQGNTFQKFVKDRNNPNSLPNNYIQKLYVDQTNSIWVLTEYGVGKYEYQTDAISRFLPEVITDHVTSMVIDDQENGFFGGYNGGIYKVKGNEATLLDLNRPKIEVDLNKLGVADIDILENKLWIATRDMGIIRLDLENGALSYLSPFNIGGKEKIRIFDMFIDRQHAIWFGTNEGVYKCEDSTVMKLIRVMENRLPKDNYLSICEDEKQNLWFGTRQNGMFALKKLQDPEDILIQHFPPSSYTDGISHRTISKIFQDDNGLFWLGTHNGGINVFDPKGEKVRTITHQFHNSSSINYQNVWGICESQNGLIWVGTDGKGLNLFDPDEGIVLDFKLPQLEAKAILSILEDRKSRVWIGTYANGIYVYNKNTKQLKSFEVGSTNAELTVNDIRAFYETSAGDIYIGTNQGGLYYFDEDVQKVRKFRSSSGLDIRAIASYEDGYLWLGTYGKGLIKYDLKNDQYNSYHWLEMGPGTWPVIFDIYNDHQILWLGTREDGLISFDPKNNTFLEHPLPEDINNISISGISQDMNNNLWLTTNNGVIVFDKEKKEIKKFDTNNGFQRGHFNYGSVFLSSKEYIVVGGINGMNIFYPEQLLSDPLDSRVLFNEFKVFDSKVSPINSDFFPKDKSIFLTKKIHLDHTNKVFSINFSTPGFNARKQNKFKYKLLGYEENWQLGGDSNIAAYKNVPPGNYVFEAKNLYNDDISKKLQISIAPPIWKTWPAYLLFLITLLLVIWRFVRFYNTRIVLKQKLIHEKELREKEQDVMQEKLRFYTNFSHELKTPLTLIQGPVNDLIKKESDPNQLQYLYLIRKNTSILLKFIRRMLEFRKIEMNKILLNIGYHDLNILAQEEAENFTFLAKEKRIKFGFYSETELYAYVDIEKMQIILNNLLSNAIKFSSEGKTVKFGIFQEQDVLIIEVKDEGDGIVKEELTNIFSPFYQSSNSAGRGGTGIGLALCKSFVELHGGSINVKSEPGKGTQFLVSIPKGKKHLLQKDYVRFIKVKTEEIEKSLMSLPVENTSSLDGISDSDRVVLIVDDNKDISTYVGTLFPSDFKIIQSDNGSDALEKAIHNIPDIIISDMMMPKMDGLELCKVLKDNIATSHIPIILLTAKSSDQSKIQGFEVGADEYITKPFNSEVLIARVNNILINRKLLKIKYTSGDLVDSNSSQSPKEVAFILKVEAVILAMLETTEFSVPDLCREIGMSQTSLYRKIKKLTGDSIQLFIRKIKIKRAAELLISEDLTVTEIAFAVDFSDLKYFRKCFKEQFDMTPSKYKNKHASETDKDEVKRALNIK